MITTITTLATLATDPAYDLTSWFVADPNPEYAGATVEVFSIACTFGFRCFTHFLHQRDRDFAERLLARVREASPTVEHILSSSHWSPHPYCDGTLEERLAVEADVEAQERAAYHGGYHCDSEKAREIAKADIIETPLPSPPSNDWNWAADRAATHSGGHHGEDS